MKSFTLNNVCHSGLLTYLLLFSFMPFTAAVSFDLTELRNKVAKIKVNPRGNLWATGHFMGKKSVMDTPVVSSSEGQSPVSLPLEQDPLQELLQDFMQKVLEAQIQDTQENHSQNQEEDWLMKILERYMKSRM